MRTTLEREEEAADSEITLNATTMLGIFFGLVLICGVFFGFGYSTGRRGSETPKETTPSSAPEEAPVPAASQTPKPSAMESLQAVNSGSTSDTNTVTEPTDDSVPAQPAAPPVKQSAAVPAPAPRPSPALSAPSPAAPQVKQASLPLPQASATAPAAAGEQTFMVQIAAVSRSEDANALASALRTRGYNVVVRTETRDKLLHVQVGPFASRNAAKAMLAKLSSDGYNAILKP
jgi:DedD protein